MWIDSSTSNGRATVAKRFTISETEGQQRSFSYLVGDDFPVGSWAADEQPADLVVGEIESLSSGDNCPFFAYDPAGEIIVAVSEL